jgi:hypothetical protein
MSTWDLVLTERLRYVINDLDPAQYTWTDTQLQKFLSISAIQVLNDTKRWSNLFSVAYIINTYTTG